MDRKSFQAMSNLDLFYLLRELSMLKGARLAKVYGFAPDSPNIFRFKFNTAIGERNLYVDLNAGLWFTKYLKEAPKQPDQFVTKLRKDLKNAVVLEVKQINFDRIISMEFSTKVGKRILVIEFIGGGNLLLLGEDEKIIQVSESRTYAARKLCAGARYTPPPSEKKNPRELVKSDLRELQGNAISALFKKVNLSPFYLEEACARAGVETDKKIELFNEEQCEAIINTCNKLLEEEFTPRIYEESGRPVAFAPFELKKIKNMTVRRFDSFSEALDTYFESVGSTSTAHEKNVIINQLKDELDKLQKLFERQEYAAAVFENEAKEKKAIGDWIKDNVILVERLVSEAKAVKKEQIEVVEKRLLEFSRQFKQVKLDGAEIVLEID